MIVIPDVTWILKGQIQSAVVMYHLYAVLWVMLLPL